MCIWSLVDWIVANRNLLQLDRNVGFIPNFRRRNEPRVDARTSRLLIDAKRCRLHWKGLVVARGSYREARLRTTVEQQAAERTKSERLLQDDSVDSSSGTSVGLSCLFLSCSLSPSPSPSPALVVLLASKPINYLHLHFLPLDNETFFQSRLERSRRASFSNFPKLF